MAAAPRYVTALQTRVMREHMDIHIKHMKARHGEDSMPCFFYIKVSLFDKPLIANNLFFSEISRCKRSPFSL